MALFCDVMKVKMTLTLRHKSQNDNCYKILLFIDTKNQYSHFNFFIFVYSLSDKELITG